MTAPISQPPEPRSTPPDDATTLAKRRTTLADLRSHLANERTHLAYVRTSVALLGFGITLNRFSIYLGQEQKVQADERVLALYDVETIGIGMAVAGLGLLAWSLYRFWTTSRDIERGSFEAHFKSVVVVTAVLFALGGLSTLWLMGH